LLLTPPAVLRDPLTSAAVSLRYMFSGLPAKTGRNPIRVEREHDRVVITRNGHDAAALIRLPRG
jgi:hypothetical protein